MLGIVADNAIAKDLRIEASKCIGQIGSGAFGELLNIDFTPCPAIDWLKSTDSDKRSLMACMTSKVLESLVGHIKEDPQSESAQAALKACQEIALFQQDAGALCRMAIGYVKRFISTERRPRVDELTPSPDFVTNAFTLSISQNRFLDFNDFQPSLSDVPVLKNRKAPRRFGSVLELKPMTPPLMFMASNKVASAIYYAEMALSETGFDLSESRFSNSLHTSLMPLGEGDQIG